jgi:hypothetical protein
LFSWRQHRSSATCWCGGMCDAACCGFIGCAEVIKGYLPGEAPFDSTSVHVGVVVDIVALDKLFAEYICFATSVSQQMLHIHSSPTLSNFGIRQCSEVTHPPFPHCTQALNCMYSLCT